MSDIKVLIADDHDLIRQGIKKIIELEDDISVIGEAANGNELLSMIRDYKPDLVVTDMHMPNYDGVKLIEAIRIEYPSLSIVVVSMEDNELVVSKAIEVGADGYLLKESAGRDIVEAIRLVHEGKGFIDKSLVAMLMFNMKHKNVVQVSVFDELTKREIEIYTCMIKGMSNKEIGEVLYLAEKTVKNYSTKIFRKLEVKDRVHAILLSVDKEFQKYYEKK